MFCQSSSRYITFQLLPSYMDLVLGGIVLHHFISCTFDDQLNISPAELDQIYISPSELDQLYISPSVPTQLYRCSPVLPRAQVTHQHLFLPGFCQHLASGHHHR